MRIQVINFNKQSVYNTSVKTLSIQKFGFGKHYGTSVRILGSQKIGFSSHRFYNTSVRILDQKKKPSVYDVFYEDYMNNKVHNPFFYRVSPAGAKYHCSMADFVTKRVRWDKNYLLSFIGNHLIHYPAPINLSYAWSFGSSAGICLVIQILYGFFTAIHYTPASRFSFY